MTVLYYSSREKKVYADRAHSFGVLSINESKIIPYKSCFIVLCGLAAKFTQAAKNRIDKDTSKNDFNTEGAGGGFIIYPKDQRIEQLTSKTIDGKDVDVWADVTAGDCCEGSGHPVLLQALAAGLTTQEALRFTLDYAPGCGFNIDTITLDGVYTECLF